MRKSVVSGRVSENKLVFVTITMLFPKTALFYGFLIALLLEPISGRKGFSGGHSYPKSGGLSGGGHRSGGLSGGGHGYPSSGGSHHGYPSSGGSHGYPSSGGSHGYPSGGLSGGSHGYPSAGGNRGSSGGSHGYPSSGGLSGSGTGHNYPSKAGYPSATNYHYTPPQQISYAPTRGAPPVNYPVYHGSPPTYVYQYKDSGSKYGTLLAGLALLNLGTLGAAAYAVHSSSSKSHTPIPGEVCKFAIKKDNGDYEETRIDCNIISSFILQDQAEKQHGGSNSTVITTTTVTNTTTINRANEMPEQTTQPPPVVPALGNVLYAMLPNGTLVPVNASSMPIVPGLPGNPENATHNETSTASPNGTGVNLASSVVVTTTTTNTTVVDALDVKGAPVNVTPGMKCYVIRNSPTSNMRKSVPCGLLQTYAEKSITKSSAAHNVPMFTMITAILAFCIAY